MRVASDTRDYIFDQVYLCIFIILCFIIQSVAFLHPKRCRILYIKIAIMTSYSNEKEVFLFFRTLHHPHQHSWHGNGCLCLLL